MRVDRLLGESGALVFQSWEDFCRYCENITADRNLEMLWDDITALPELYEIRI